MRNTTVTILCGLTILLLVFTGCVDIDGVEQLEFVDDFSEGNDGWEAGFADLPIDYDNTIFELESGIRTLPDDLDGYGFYLQGHNRSDDLFMYITKQVTGLLPNTTYQIIYSIDLATDVPAGMMGIGGSPGESVYVKVGGSTIKPVTEEKDDGLIYINIDKGNQASEGGDMVNIGNLASEKTDGSQFVIESLSIKDFETTTDSDGNLWLIVGTDSGFEGLSTVYYAQIEVFLIAK